MLILNPDLYSKRHVQWYYFRVSNMETTPIYTFHIVNFEKSKSLYSKGLQPLLYSEHEARATGVGWRRVGWNMSYTQSRVNYPPHMSPLRSYFTLTWSMRFYHHGDTCYLAHCYPYPLSALYTLLGKIEEDSERSKYIQREELCRTLAGNPCPLLTVTEFTGEEEEGRKKRGVVVTARVHPGETNSSWMMEGLILFLTSNSPHSHALRKSFVFKLVPMLNPDGVVVGNYRTSLAGVDLNRVFRTPVTAAFPTIFHTKKMMNSFQQEREVCIYVDLHGHSRKHNVFMYGCHTPKADHTQFLYERLLPFLLSEQAADMFCLESCKFAVQRCKESTGRVVTWRSGVPNSFTLEATFCGSNLGPNRDRDLLRMGSNLGEAFYKFSKCLQSKTYVHTRLSLLRRWHHSAFAKAGKL
ncbi:Cytosolic carboxypeptidase 3 [Geodia barretti]|uniref:Cytosolic carboxypeptidase 3 n=1 Tax=Geodia barretti TaxID=519541 RepID=A0AA35WP39_GEOBA|nr:Cytosolic carboxypeptidase 3 [Geodia barretti]